MGEEERFVSGCPTGREGIKEINTKVGEKRKGCRVTNTGEIDEFLIPDMFSKLCDEIHKICLVHEQLRCICDDEKDCVVVLC